MVSPQKLDCTKIDQVPSYFQLPPRTLVNSKANLIVAVAKDTPGRRTDTPPTVMLRYNATTERASCKCPSILSYHHRYSDACC
jgi:hypothetical protein